MVVLVFGRFGTENGFKRIRIVTCVPCLGAHGHGRWGEVLYLFEMEIKPFGAHGQAGHVCLLTCRMAAHEVRNDLLPKIFLLIYLVEDALKFLKLCKTWLSHATQHLVAGVFGSHFKTPTHVISYQFLGIFHRCIIHFLVFALVEQQVVAYTTADKTFLYLRQSVHGAIYFDEFRVVGVEVWAYFGIDARRPFAHFARFFVAPSHAIHVGRWSA